MRVGILTAASTVIALANTQVVDDLKSRAMAEIARIEHASSAQDALRLRPVFLTSLRASLGFNSRFQLKDHTALLYAPENPGEPSPAILLVQPHTDPSSAEARILPQSFTRLGFIVLALDLRQDHSDQTQIPARLMPAGLMQRHIDAGLRYLMARPDVDPKRIAVVGDSLTATIAVALNPQIAAAVLVDGVPDISSWIDKLHDMGPGVQPDPCNLIPGLLRIGTTEELIAAIAPRPVLALNPTSNQLDYAKQLYSSFSAGTWFEGESGDLANPDSRWTVYSWVTRHLKSQNGPFASPERGEVIEPAKISLQAISSNADLISFRGPLNVGTMESLLGTPVQPGWMHMALNLAQKQEIHFETQASFNLPVTVYRPGPEGGDPGRGLLIAASDQGRRSLDQDENVQNAVKQGWMVWTVDLRGVGDLAPGNPDAVFALSVLLSENFTWRQAYDLKRVVAFAQSGSRGRVRVYGQGQGVALAVAYLAAAPQSRELESVFYTGLPDSYFAPSITRWSVPFGTAGVFDIHDVIGISQVPATVLADGKQITDW